MDDTDRELDLAARRAAEHAEEIATLVAEIIEEHASCPAISVAAGVIAPALALMTQMDDSQRNLAMKLVDSMLTARDINAKLAYLGEINAEESQSN